MITTLHPFERAGLGKAPFRYVGLVAQEIAHGQRVIGSVGGAAITTKPGGTCAYCGTYIVNMFRVESADGQQFHVGCDCIHKINDPGLSRAVTADEKRMKAAREVARIESARRTLAEGHVLRDTPHPNPGLAADGRTMADYCDWLFAHAGRTGQLRAARLVEAASAPRAED